MEKVIEVKHVTKEIGNNLIIDDVSFALEEGRIYGLVGQNGSGKSTLLKIILGLYDSSGEVFINGKNLRNNFSEAMKYVSGIVDYVSFYDYLTAYENVRYFSMVYDVHFSKVREVLDLVGLDAKDKKPVSKYSLGMKQRLGIAISLLKEPKVLILDEPMNGLDPIGIAELRKLLLSFKDKTIIISSHIISEIEKIVDEVLFINNGKIIRKSIKREDDRIPILFRVNDYESAAKVLDNPLLNEEKAIYMNDLEVAEAVNKLSKSDIDVYRVESESLESELLRMLEGVNNDWIDFCGAL